MTILKCSRFAVGGGSPCRRSPLGRPPTFSASIHTVAGVKGIVAKADGLARQSCWSLDARRPESAAASRVPWTNPAACCCRHTAHLGGEWQDRIAVLLAPRSGRFPPGTEKLTVQHQSSGPGTLLMRCSIVAIASSPLTFLLTQVEEEGFRSW